MPNLWPNTFHGLNQFKTPPIPIKNTSTTLPKNQRLGKVAESLFSEWIQSSQNFKVVLENLQIINNKQTIGELDAIILNTKTNTYLHLELVTKFYLLNPVFNCNNIKAWIGPNRNDSLAHKIDKLKNKQFPLLYNLHTKNKLKEYDINTKNTIQQVVFKAWLFVPLKFKETLNTFNNNCIAGNYVTFSEFKSICIKNQQYFCPNKLDWLRLPETQTLWYPLAKVIPMIELFMQKQQAIMVWTQYEAIYKRYIIVPYSKF